MLSSKMHRVNYLNILDTEGINSLTEQTERYSEVV